jgi:hypothetical protein
MGEGTMFAMTSPALNDTPDDLDSPSTQPTRDAVDLYLSRLDIYLNY